MTHIDDTLVVAYEQIAQDPGLVEVPQADHVLHPVDGSGMHGLNVGGILGQDPVLLMGEQSQPLRNYGVIGYCVSISVC